MAHRCAAALPRLQQVKGAGRARRGRHRRKGGVLYNGTTRKSAGVCSLHTSRALSNAISSVLPSANTLQTAQHALNTKTPASQRHGLVDKRPGPPATTFPSTKLQPLPSFAHPHPTFKLAVHQAPAGAVQHDADGVPAVVGAAALRAGGARWLRGWRHGTVAQHSILAASGGDSTRGKTISRALVLGPSPCRSAQPAAGASSSAHLTRQEDTSTTCFPPCSLHTSTTFFTPCSAQGQAGSVSEQRGHCHLGNQAVTLRTGRC